MASFTFHSFLKITCAPAAAVLLAAQPLRAAAEDYAPLPTLKISRQQTANTEPVTTYESPISNLDFDPRLDLQARSMAEAQGDISIRGGIFENTGIRVGSATLIDPQTGHYFTELPIAPEMLQGPDVQTGSENALYGFNSTVGTVSYGWSQIADGGSLTLGGGDHGLNFQRLHQGWTQALGESGEWSLGIEAESSRSESDGTVTFGDHEFDRSTGRIQLLGPNSQTDLFAGYQAKFFGWPELYAAPFGSNETENLKTRLFVINHRQDYGDQSYWEATGYSRRHSDHYIYNRAAPNQAYVHETKVHAVGLSGKHSFSPAFALNHAAQFTADQIDSTTLENYFTSRSYFKLSLLPEYRFELSQSDSLTVRAGASFDDSNRDDSQLSPTFDLTWQRSASNGDTDRVYLSYAETSQVPGYNAIGGSETIGLFRSNRDLGRETSQNLELGWAVQRSNWSFESAIFYRWDNDLVDWTFNNVTPNARAANAVDIETCGIELIGTRQWGQFEGIASYTYLHKREDYGNAAVDASFYALNFPDHRATLGLLWQPCAFIEVRLDNEWRSQQANALREGPSSALFTQLGLSLYPPSVQGLEIFFAMDKPWQEDFQEVPGTPGRGDQFSAGATYRW